MIREDTELLTELARLKEYMTLLALHIWKARWCRRLLQRWPQSSQTPRLRPM